MIAPSKSFFSVNFNTSHVLIYRLISIIIPLDKMNFNTSHVLIYLWKRLRIIHRILHFNTSHVLIYPNRCLKLCACTLFQYISCSYLSVSIMSLSLPLSNFNTSHVLIYRSYPHKVLFTCRISIHLMFLFIPAS